MVPLLVTVWARRAIAWLCAALVITESLIAHDLPQIAVADPIDFELPAPTIAKPVERSISVPGCQELGPLSPDPCVQQAVARAIARPNNPITWQAAAKAAWRTARRDSVCGSDRAVDYYYQAATFAWAAIRCEPSTPRCAARMDGCASALKLYHRSLRCLLLAAAQHGRLSLANSLMVNSPAGSIVVPVVRRGFPWIAADFDQLVFIGNASKLRCRYAWCGLGVPSVVLRHRKWRCDGRDQYFVDRHAFAATWVLVPDLRPWLGDDATAIAGDPPRLECCDPLRVRSIDIGGAPVQLAGNISAPLEWFAENNDGNRLALEGFLRPESSTVRSGMVMLEPYQPGKIPVVFVHGLAGNPDNWLELANDLRADPCVTARFQLWAFTYPTGASFLSTAAKLRCDLPLAAANCDPCGCDPALQRIVMVGHSMGGLLTKLQVTAGGTHIWNAFFKESFGNVKMSAETRSKLRRLMFFTPNPLVTRAVFVATPHDGAPSGRGATRLLASALLERPAEAEAMHREIRQHNPRALRRWVRRRLPTSVDMLALANPLVRALRQSPVCPHIRLHTIYGKVPNVVTLRPSDRVVPVASAQHAGVDSVVEVRAGHARVHSQPETAQEIRRILRVHLAAAN